MGWGFLGWAWLAFLPWAGLLAWRDLRRRKLDDALTLPCAVGGIAIAAAAGEPGGGLAGMALWGLAYAAVGVGKPGAMGGGDVKLALGLGALTGAAGGIPATAAAMAAAGLLTAAAGTLKGWRTGVPHGPSMLASATAAMALAG